MLDPARFASKPSFCLQSTRWLFQCVWIGVSGYQVLPFASLSGLLLGGSLLPERVDKAKLAQTGPCWTSPGGSLLPVCYGDILVNGSS